MVVVDDVVGAVDVEDAGEVEGVVVRAAPSVECGTVGWPVVAVFGAAFGEKVQAARDRAAAALTVATATMRRLEATSRPRR